jgi:hypothetical protein
MRNHFLRAATGKKLWTPAQITTALWLDAADTSTINLNGSTVSQWNDKSGNSKNALQATESQQPTYSATSFLGKPGITTDGVSDSLIIAGLSSQISNQTHGVYWVFLRVANISVAYQPSVAVYSTNGSIDIGSLHYVKSDSSGASYPYFNNPVANSYDGSGTYVNNTGNIMAFQANTAGTAWQVHKDGTVEGTTSGIATPSSSAINGYVLGKQINPLRHSNFTFAEMVMVQSTSVDTRQRIEGYLAHKWGLTANLPASHPYKSAAPT